MGEFKEKLCSLTKAASLIQDGARIAFGGFTVHNHPRAFVYELIRKGMKDLTIVGHVNGMEVDILVGAGWVRKIETSYVGLEEFGLAPRFRRAVERGEVEVADYGETLALERFKGSARGQPFFPSYQLVGADIPKYSPDIKEGVNPFDGRKYHALSAAEPERAVVHAPMGDKFGNVFI